MIKERHFEREGRGRRGPWGPPLGGWRGQHRHGGRARRGDVRAAILALLAERPMHGYEVIRELGERTGGVWQPSPGSVYPTLQMLEDEGLVSVEEADGRKRYTLTDQGRTEAERRSSDTTPWDEVTQGPIPARWTCAARCSRRSERSGRSPRAARRSRSSGCGKLLVETRKRLYSILAEEE